MLLTPHKDLISSLIYRTLMTVVRRVGWCGVGHLNLNDLLRSKTCCTRTTKRCGFAISWKVCFRSARHHATPLRIIGIGIEFIEESFFNDNDALEHFTGKGREGV